MVNAVMHIPKVINPIIKELDNKTKWAWMLLSVENPINSASILTHIPNIIIAGRLIFIWFFLSVIPSFIISIPKASIINPPPIEGIVNIYLLNIPPENPPIYANKNWKKLKDITKARALYRFIFWLKPNDKAKPKASEPNAIEIIIKSEKDKWIPPEIFFAAY